MLFSVRTPRSWVPSVDAFINGGTFSKLVSSVDFISVDAFSVRTAARRTVSALPGAAAAAENQLREGETLDVGRLEDLALAPWRRRHRRRRRRGQHLAARRALGCCWWSGSGASGLSDGSSGVAGAERGGSWGNRRSF